MPRYQDLKHDHPDMLIPFTISLEEALNGTHVEDTLTTAHRWMHATVADVDGVQLEAIREHLRANPQIKRVWYDFSCMPQGGDERSAAEIADVQRMMAKINLLYLGTSVLILLDLSFPSRFWTQYEVRHISSHELAYKAPARHGPPHSSDFFYARPPPSKS